jgi:hypothetical protein
MNHLGLLFEIFQIGQDWHCNHQSVRSHQGVSHRRLAGAEEYVTGNRELQIAPTLQVWAFWKGSLRYENEYFLADEECVTQI